MPVPSRTNPTQRLAEEPTVTANLAAARTETTVGDAIAAVSTARKCRKACRIGMSIRARTLLPIGKKAARIIRDDPGDNNIMYWSDAKCIS